MIGLSAESSRTTTTETAIKLATINSIKLHPLVSVARSITKV